MKEFISRGLYNVRDASRILDLKNDAIIRWAFGYHRQGTFYEGITPAEVPDVHGRHAITFLELIQLLTVREFKEAGASWKLIRAAYEHARESLRTDYPFARNNWLADPAGIYHKVGKSTILTEMSSKGRQTALEETLAAYLKRMDFDAEGTTERWYPLGRMREVVIDPAVSFGAPTIRGTAIRTDTIRLMYEGGEDVDAVAWWYEIEAHQVEAALEYERRLAA